MGIKRFGARTTWFIALFIIVAGFAANGPVAAAAAEALTFEGVWARAASAGHMSAVYMTITNYGDADVDIVAAQSDVADRVEVHETTTEITFEDGKISQVMRMAEVDAITVVSGAEVALKPGGLHIMLIDLTRDIEEGDRFVLTLELGTGEHVTMDVSVTTGTGDDDDHHHHHDH